MEVDFADSDLSQLETGASYRGKWALAIVTAYRKRVQYIRAALDERDLYAMKSFHFEKLKGRRAHQYSMRLNDQYRLVVELHGEAPKKVVRIMSIEDYH